MAKYIPEQHYITWRNFADKQPLAFMTVYGTDQAAKNRMATADTWVGGHRGAILPVKHVLTNEPLSGFQVSKEVRRWSTSNVVWRIDDPRGFQLEISSNNMAYLLGFCTIKQGAFEDELIWVRDGKDNYLLPTASEEFKTYERNSKAKVSTTKISEVGVGDRISMLTGETGIYLGMYSCVKMGSNWRNSKILDPKRYHMVRDEQNPDNIEYVARSTWKGITIEKRGVSEDKDYSDEMNQNIKNVRAPMKINYVCKGKFDIKGTLATIKTIPFQRNDHGNYYYMHYKNLIYRGGCRQDSWEGSIYPYDMKPDRNHAAYDGRNSIQVANHECNYWSRHENILVSEIKDIDKFVYAIVIDGDEYVLDL